jgi:acyl-CoA thioester hydrolase
MAVFTYECRVTYADCVIGNHVYYSRYLEMLEAARGEFFRHIGQPLAQLQQLEVAFPVIECRLRYRAPARYDDTLRVELWPTQAEGARLEFGFRIFNQADTLILEGETLHVCAGLSEKPKRLPEELCRRMGPFVAQSASSA